jgi:HD domain
MMEQSMVDDPALVGPDDAGAFRILARVTQAAATPGQHALEVALKGIRRLLRAEAGSLFLAEDGFLRRAVTQSDGVGFDGAGASVVPSVLERVDPLPACVAASSGEAVNIPNAYRVSSDEPYEVDRSIEDAVGLRIENMLALPLLRPTDPSLVIRHAGKRCAVAVVELLNHRDAEGQCVPFPAQIPDRVVPLLDLLALVIENGQLHQRLSESVEDSVRRLSLAAELREDPHASDHVRRMSYVCGLLAERMGLPPLQVDLIRIAAPMHDLGKIGISGSILYKNGRLDAEERLEIQRHTRIGAEQILKEPWNDLLETAHDIAMTHHERWDGKGYPNQLAGEDIPLSGRIAALADVFDALISRRCYKDPMPLAQVREIIAKERGHHFDPQVVDAFFDVIDEVMEAYESLTMG